jgi:hypothetical protein
VVFKWDQQRAATNLEKHRIDFHEAATVLQDALSTTFPDPDNSKPGDQRFLSIGMSDRQRILVIAHSEEGETVRIISARRATRRERRFYEEDEF